MSSMSLWWTTRLFSLVSSWLLCLDVNATINSVVNAGAPLRNAPDETLNELFKYSIVFDTTTNLNVAEDQSTESSKNKVLLFKDATTNWNVKEDLSTKDKGMSKSDRRWGNLRSTMLIRHCHLINWDFTSSIFIQHCHKLINTLSTNDQHWWYCLNPTIIWKVECCWVEAMHPACSDFLSCRSPQPTRLSRFNASYSLWRTYCKDLMRMNSTIQCRTGGVEGREENQACMFWTLFDLLETNSGMEENFSPTQYCSFSRAL